jgi:hypothetical protein
LVEFARMHTKPPEEENLISKYGREP